MAVVAVAAVGCAEGANSVGGDGGDGGNGGPGGGGGGGGKGGSCSTLPCIGGNGGNGGNGGFGGGGGGGNLGGQAGFGVWGTHGSGGMGGFGGGDGADPYFDTYWTVSGGGGGASMGGAIFNHAGTVLVINSTFSANKALGGDGAEAGDGLGGAIFNMSGDVTVINSTLVNNEVGVAPDTLNGQGGAIYNYQGTVTLKNNILANTGGGQTDCYNYGGTVTAPASDKNLIENHTGCGTPALTTDPQLDPLADNGGPNQTHALQAGSPARDAGNHAVCLAAPVNGLDQRSYLRFDDACDIGAFEYGGDADSDGDALFDSWETNGYDHDGDGQIDVDLPTMGADPQHKDIFVEVDYMGVSASAPSHRPKDRAMQRIINAFANAPVSNPDGTTGINLHIDYGPDTVMDATTGLTWDSLSHADELPFAATIQAVGTAWDWSGFDAIKQLDSARAKVFHYVIFAHTLGADIPLGTSGYSRKIGASDFVASLGQWTSGVGTENEQAGTLMHELGHNLGLRHGGNDDVNHKPNYLSIMSYAFQTNGLIVNGQGGHFDYSRFNNIPALDENDLDETIGLNGGSAISSYGTRHFCRSGSTWQNIRTDNANGPIDWDCSGAIGAGVVANINDGKESNPDATLGELTGYEDWPNLVYDGGDVGLTDPPAADELSLQAEPEDELTYEEALKLETPYALTMDIGLGTFTLAPGTSTTLPVTVANRGSLPATVNLSTTYTSGQNWFDTSTLPASFNLASGASQTFDLPVNVPASAVVDSDTDRLTLIVEPQESPLMGDSALLNVEAGYAGGGDGNVYLPIVLK